MAGDLVNKQRAEENQHNAAEIHDRTHPAGIGEEGAGKQGDDRQLCSAGHERRQHGGSAALTLVADGAAGHDAGNGAARADDEGNDGLAAEPHLLKDGIQHHADTGHVTAILQQGHQEVHDHHQRQEAHHGNDAAYNTVHQQRLHNVRCAGDEAAQRLLTCFQPAYQRVGDPRAYPRLRDLKHEEDHHGKDGNTQPLVGEDIVDLILRVLFAAEHLALLHLADNTVDEGETLTVSLLHDGLVGQVARTLLIGRDLLLTEGSDSRLHHLPQTPMRRIGRHRLHHRAAKSSAQCRSVDDRLPLFIHIALIECHHHGDTQLQQLRGKKQAAAQIGGIHDVDHGIGIGLLHERGSDALLRGKGGHGVCARQIHCQQRLRAAVKALFNRRDLFLYRHACPVTHALIASGQGVIHGSLSAVGIACQCDLHNFSRSLFFCLYRLAIANHLGKKISGTSAASLFFKFQWLPPIACRCCSVHPSRR